MRAEDVSAAQVRRLIAEVEKDRDTFARRTGEVRKYAAAEPEAAEVAALALTLDRNYTVLEAILERVARTLEGGTPVGEDWHRTLLENAGLDIEHVRSAVLSEAAVRAADEVRRFRHFLRHAYAVDLDARREAGVGLARRVDRAGDITRWVRRVPPAPGHRGRGRLSRRAPRQFCSKSFSVSAEAAFLRAGLLDPNEPRWPHPAGVLAIDERRRESALLRTGH